MPLLGSGQVTTSGTPQPLATVRVGSKKWVFKAASSNTSQVFVGISSVTTSTGFVMDPGDDFEIDCTIQQGTVYDVTPGDVYVVGSGGVVSWLAFE